MKNNKKLTLNELRVKSFQTTFTHEESETIKGGSTPFCQPQTNKSFCSNCCDA
ncbi:pinensin family lanthipeptide [Fulvivirga kasyanovii]|uniref:pinensin family lanthipeptide n=1 Tax=Fulvivirga kasyanovii TaxID=396812 RepID=UPI001C86B1AD